MTRRGRFNPCCRGSASLTAATLMANAPIPLFQSLLSWICLSDRVSPRRIVVAPGFQSLLSWICLSDATTKKDARRVGEFQSLLSWICLSDAASTPTDRDPSLFQSLLSWICLSDLSVAVVMIGPSRCFNPCCRGSASLTTPRKSWVYRFHCFNPCCRGSASLTAASGPGRRRATRVSILVVVDLPL